MVAQRAKAAKYMLACLLAEFIGSSSEFRTRVFDLGAELVEGCGRRRPSNSVVDGQLVAEKTYLLRVPYDGFYIYISYIYITRV